MVDRTQQQIPQIVETADNAVAAINQTRDEVVPLVPPMLEQVELTREAIDPTLSRVEDLVEDTYFKSQDVIAGAQEAGQEASEGAVKGFFTGIIKLPFELVGTLASPIVKSLDPKIAEQLTEEDLKLMAKVGRKAVASKNTNKEWRWENPESKNSGTIVILRKFDQDKLDCIEAELSISRNKRKIYEGIDEFCIDENKKWVLASDVDK